MGADEFESWVETLELLSNPKAVKSLKQGLKEAKSWKPHSFKDAFGEGAVRQVRLTPQAFKDIKDCGGPM